MNKGEVYTLIKQFSNETAHYGYTATDHPAYKELANAGKEILPFLLERLEDSVNRDIGLRFDPDNDPWLTINLIIRASDEACIEGFSYEHAGWLVGLRSHILKWGESYLR